MGNPYTKAFGKKPNENISRTSLIDKISSEFFSENPESGLYVITGIIGSGKTVVLTEIVEEFQSDPDWICIEINSASSDMLKNLASQLYARKSVFNAIRHANLNLSYLGLGVEINGEPPVTDYATAVEKILKQIQRIKKHVLVTIDEIIATDASKEFIQQFQIYQRHNLPIYMVATGLYRDFRKIKNSPGMTFLYRAPRFQLENLDLIEIANSYQKNFTIDRKTALAMAKMTNGYSFGFQVLGYICFDLQKPYTDAEVIHQFDHEMYEKVYRKVWSETTKVEKEYLNGMANAESSKVEDIRKQLHIDNNHFNPIRRRLLEQGVVNSNSNGYLSLTLPRFDIFVKEMYILDWDF